jgi:isoleucyl-tRNA synthetase
MYGAKNLDIDLDNGFSNKNELDAWIDIKLNTLVKNITENLDSYQIDRAAKPILDFVEELSTWYLRRCRDRFKDSEGELVTKNLLIVLITLSKVIAPFTPFIAEEIYLFAKDFANVIDAKESVHLESWPEVKDIRDISVLVKMEQTRSIVMQGLALRNKTGIKVRQPLEAISVSKEMIENIYLDIIKDELNVKNVTEGEEIVLDTNITEELRIEGLVRDMIREIQSKRKDLDLVPSDKISLTLKTKEKISSYLDMIKSAVNSDSIETTHSEEVEITVTKV